MENSGTFALEKMQPRGRAVLEKFVLHYRAEMAEALLAGEAPPQRKRHEAWSDLKEIKVKKAPSMGQTVLNIMAEAPKRERESIAKRLMTAPLMGRPLTAHEITMLRKWVQPGSKVPMIERTNLTQYMTEVWSPKEPIKDKQEFVKWQQGVLGDLLPQFAMPESDGRPDDAEPDVPEETEEPGTPAPPNGAPVSPYSDLLFHVDQIECVDTTNGEAGDDEINYTGIGVSGPLASFISPADVGAETMAIRNAGSFGQGDIIDESVRGPMHLWSLAGLPLPELFLVHLLMAEIDPRGGFETYRDNVMDSLAYEGPDIFLYFAVAVVWSGAGWAAVGAMGGPLGAAIGFLAGAVAGAIQFLVTYGNHDDIFDLGVGFLVLEPNALNLPPFNGNAHSTPFDAELTGDGGTYILTYHWELRGGSAVGPGDQDTDQPVFS